MMSALNLRKDLEYTKKELDGMELREIKSAYQTNIGVPNFLRDYSDFRHMFNEDTRDADAVIFLSDAVPVGMGF